MNIYEIHATNPFAKRVNSNRTTRKVHGMRGHQHEYLRSFANIFDFASLRKSIRNHTYSLKSIKAMKIFEKLQKSMEFHKNRWNLGQSIRILEIYGNLLNPCSSSIREACQLKPHYTESTRSARPPEWMFNKLRKHLWLWKSLQIHSKPCISIEIYRSYETYEKQWQPMKIYKNRWNLWKSMIILKTYENL